MVGATLPAVGLQQVFCLVSEDREGPSHLPLFFPGSLVGDVGPQAGNLRLQEQELLPSEKGASGGTYVHEPHGCWCPQRRVLTKHRLLDFCAGKDVKQKRRAQDPKHAGRGGVAAALGGTPSHLGRPVAAQAGPPGSTPPAAMRSWPPRQEELRHRPAGPTAPCGRGPDGEGLVPGELSTQSAGAPGGGRAARVL